MSTENPLIEELRDRSYFFDNGLRFECQQCGRCCNGEPGLIHAEEEEILAISHYLQLERDILLDRCLYRYEGGYSVREDETCRFLFFENGCSIYPVRPMQCRTFPFWFQYLRSEEGWQEAMNRCPGVGNGRLYSKEEIFELLEASLCMHMRQMQPDIG